MSGKKTAGKSSKKNQDASEERSFEDELEKLRNAVSHLESDELTLEDAFKQFETGWNSYRSCREILEETRSRVETLIAESPAASPDDDDLEWKPFDWGDPAGGTR